MSRNLANNPNGSAFNISGEGEDRCEELNPKPLSLSKDGYVRLSQHALTKIVLQHLISGLDDDDALAPKSGDLSTISGYTEWQSTTDPAISIGWDWHLEISQGKFLYALCGMPRSNIMLVDERDNKDLGPVTTENFLKELIETTGWECTVQEYINERYQ